MTFSKFRFMSHACIAGMVIMFSGCATNKIVQPEERIVVTPNVDSLKELKSISIEARNELRLLAKAQQAKNEKILTDDQKKQSFFQATYIPPGFEKVVDFHYIGEVDKAVQALSMIADYKLISPDGGKPSTPIWVNISLENQSLNEALKEIGVQAGDKVRVEIHPSAKLIRLIYK